MNESSHSQYEELVATYAAGYLEGRDLIEFESHLEGCDQCRTELAEYEQLAAEIEYGLPATPSDPSRKQALMSKIRASVGVPARESLPSTAEPSLLLQVRRTELPFVGRERELGAIIGRIRDLSSGEGSLLAIEGGAGVGKSRLLAELEREANEARALVLRGRSSEDDDDLGYQPFLDILRAWIGTNREADNQETPSLRFDRAIAELGDDFSELNVQAVARLLDVSRTDEQSRAIKDIEGEPLERLIQSSVGSFLSAAARKQALVLLFEDVHFADPSSLEMLKEVFSLASTSRVLIVWTARSGHGDAAGDLANDCVDRFALRYHRLALAPLESQDSRRLLRSALGRPEFPQEIVDFVLPLAEGNPLFIGEIVRMLVDEEFVKLDGDRVEIVRELGGVNAADVVGSAITRRLDRLAPELRDVLFAAATLGRRERLKAVVALCTGTEKTAPIADSMAELERRGFLTATDSRNTGRRNVVLLRPEPAYEFTHALVRDAVYSQIPTEVAKRLHAEAASIIENESGADTSDVAAVLAGHHSRAGDAVAATKFLLEAGDRARETAASDEALRLYREAHRYYRVAYGSSGPKELEAKLESNLATALLNTGKLGESIGHANHALRLHGQWVPRSKAGLYAKLAWDVPNVLARLYTGNLIAKHPTSDPAIKEVYTLMYNRCRAQNIIDAERNFFDNFSVFHYAAKCRDASTVDHAAGSLAATGAFFAWSGLPRSIGRRFLGAAEELAACGSDADRFLVKTMSFVDAFIAGDWDVRHDIDDELFEVGLRHGFLWDADVYLGMRVERDIRQGRFAEAQAGIEKLALLSSDWGYDFAESNELAQKAYLAAEKRELEPATEAVDRWYESRQEGTLHVLALSTKAKISILGGESDLANRHLVDAKRLQKQEGFIAPYYTACYHAACLRSAVAGAADAVNAGATTADTDRATVRSALKVSNKVFRERTEVLGLVAKSHFLGGRLDEACKYWIDAIDAGESAKVRPEIARIARDIGLLLASSDSTASADDESAARTIKGRSPFEWLTYAKDLMAELGLKCELAELNKDLHKRRKVA